MAILADTIRRAEAEGRDTTVVVPQPTCGYVLKHDYPDYLDSDDARLVAEHTEDACEYLVGLHKGEGADLDTDFGGEVPDTVTYHAPCHLRAQNIGLKSRDLLKLTGSRVTVVAECSAIDGTWGYRAENFEASRKVAAKMAKAIDKADADVVAGDCHLANGGIVQETGREPRHPLQIVARAYGIPEARRHGQLGRPRDRGRGDVKLALGDIADLREYERERDEFRAHIIDLKRRRRVSVGPFVTFVFENRDTIRFQIQEMARVERLATDEAIQNELDTYNPLVPEPGQVSATMFLELTNDADLRTWLPKLVGIETEVELRLAQGSVVRCAVDDDHLRQLTRDETTAAVHYVHWDLSPGEVDELAAGSVTMAVTHPDYGHATTLDEHTRAELVADARPTD